MREGGIPFHVKHRARDPARRLRHAYEMPRHPSGSTPPGTGAPSSYG